MKLKDLNFVQHTVCCGCHEKASVKTDAGSVDVYRNTREDGPDNYDVHIVTASGTISRHLLLSEEGAAEVLAALVQD